MADTILLSFANGTHSKLLDIARPTFEAYAKVNRFDCATRGEYVEECNRPAPWWKVPAIQRALKDYEQVLWIDADVVAMASDNIFNAMPADRVFGWVNHYVIFQRNGTKRETPTPNSGVMAIRRSEHVDKLLRFVWAQTDFINSNIWEQAAFYKAFGMRPMIPTVFPDNKQIKRNQFWQTSCFLPFRYNFWPRDIRSKSEVEKVFAHAAGMKEITQRATLMKKWVEESSI